MSDAAAKGSERWEVERKPARSRWGCFLPDLTRLASGTSTANLPLLMWTMRGFSASGPAGLCSDGKSRIAQLKALSHSAFFDDHSVDDAGFIVKPTREEAGDEPSRQRCEPEKPELRDVRAAIGQSG